MQKRQSNEVEKRQSKEVDLEVIDIAEEEMNEVITRWGGKNEAELRAAIFCSFVDR
jgi:hypothetical protein